MNKLVITQDFLNNLYVDQQNTRNLMKKIKEKKLKKTLKKGKKNLEYLKRNNIDLKSNLSKPKIPKFSEYLKNKENFFIQKKQNFENIFESSLNIYLKNFKKHKNFPKYTKMSNYNLLKILKAFPESEKKLLKMVEEPFLKTVSRRKQILNVLCKHKNEKKKIELVSQNVKKIYLKNLQKRINLVDNKNYNFEKIKNGFKSNEKNMFCLKKVNKNNFSKRCFSLSNFKNLKNKNKKIDLISRKTNIVLDKYPKFYKTIKNNNRIRPSKIHIFKNDS